MAVRASTWSELQCKLPWRGAPMPSNCATRKDGRRNGEMKLLSIVLWNRPQSTPESRNPNTQCGYAGRAAAPTGPALPPSPGALSTVTRATLSYSSHNHIYSNYY